MLVLLRDIHSKLITQYDYKVCAQSQSQVNERPVLDRALSHRLT
jgi:hypothetical protein